jgi:hypothetical protein
MTFESPDERIGRLLAEERREDEARAPELARLLARPSRRRAGGSSPRRRAVLAAATLAIVFATIAILGRPARPRATTADAGSGLDSTAVALSRWKAPTDVFLQTPGLELASRVPVLVSRPMALDFPPVSEPTKGARP